MRRIALLFALGLFALPAACLADVPDSEVPDWEAVADVSTIVVETQDEDGSERETTIWLAVLDGRGYIRTGGTRWGENLVRNPALEFEIEVEDETEDYELRVEFVEDDALRERITTAFNEKYGWPDSLMGMFRGDRPKIMRLLPR